MQIPREAIEKAIEGGWNCGIHFGVEQFDTPDYLVTQVTDNWQTLALDKTFWQALGKALGWAKEVKGDFAEEAFFVTCEQKAMRFYRLVFNGTDTEKFWADLLVVVK